MSVPFGDYGDAFFEKRRDLVGIPRQPLRHKSLPREAMSFGLESVFFAEIHQNVRRRTAIDAGTAGGETVLVRFRFQRVPVKGNDRMIEKIQKSFFVEKIFIFLLEMHKHESIAPE